jgi:hypothetical protein
MIEPTESESKAELDRFCAAMIAIRQEIAKVERGEWPRGDNPLENAPHTAEVVMADEWTHAYSREQAAFPLPWVRGAKFWPAVGRIDSPADLGELFQPPAPSSVGEPLAGRLFGDRGPQAVTAPGRPRVLVETGSRAAGDQPLRSTAGETPGRNAEKNEESRHRLAEQMEGDLSPEEIDEIAEEVIGILRREVEFDMARLGEDEWD